MTSRSKRVFTVNNISGQVPEAAGTSVSQQSALEVGQQLDVSKLSASSYTLEDAYWSDQHRKMGIARSLQQEPASEEAYVKIQEEQIKFIKKHFTQKECRRFVPQPDQCGNGKSCKVKALKCHCGENLSVHFENGSTIPEEYISLARRLEDILTETLPAPKVKWSAKDDFTKSVTNAFGKIDFNIEQIGGKKPAKYVRLSSDDSVDDCLELMKKFWYFMEPEPPKLVISVVGGAKNFKLDGRNRSIFSTGLIKAAKTTKAWLITSGFNMGVMKSVGQAVHEGQSFQWSNDRVSHVLRCIGIAPWGYVKDRQCLESDGNGKFNAHYRSSTVIEHKQPVPLNPDHTHFIFVDDGYRARYGGVAKFRSGFEKKIAQDTDGGLGIPVVLLLVEGGTDAIQDVSASLSQGIPVVVCAGTGRAADIIAYAFNHTVTVNSKQRTMSENNREKLKQKIAQTYKPKDEELENLTANVIKSCQQEDLKHEELDLAILSVLLKGKTNSSLASQLMLAMTWNRADIAQEEIFREDVNWSEESLESFLTTALIEDKIEFVKLLLNNGIIMQEYLTTQRLETLYNSIPEHFYLHQILKTSANSKTGPFTVKDISNFLQDLLDRYDDDELVGNQKGPKLFRNPYKQLLIWAVLMNRSELAHLFLELGEEPITSALICTALCSGMESKVPKFMSVIRDSFHNMKVEFEKLAIGVLDECHGNNPDKAVMLVGRKSPVWSNLTCLQIAISAADQAFVSSVACQNSIDNVWKSGIISSWPKVFMCAVFPPFILFFVEMNLMGRKVMSKTQKILTFYTAPLTKFSLFSAAYVVFLALFTYMISVDYNQVPSVTEWIAIVWIFTFFVGKIHAFLVFPSASFSGKMRDYFGIFDRLDFVNLVLAMCAFCVRWSHVNEGKVIYCINAIIFYISIMKLYTANRILGPKLYMINRMLVELGNFCMVLVVFLLAYGVASQALLYKHRDTSWQILKDILYFPYWQLYGELFLEELETDDACTRALQDSLNGALTDVENTCRTFHWLVPVLLALYLLMGNVLLLNLLIAIFSHVFETVENNSIEIWKFQMYFLVMEFQNQPLMFPPLSVFFNAWHFIQWMCNWLSCHKQPKPEQFRKYHLEYLSLFEKEMLANKLRPVKANIIYSLDMKFNALLNRMDELTKMIEEEVLSNLPNETLKSKQETNNTKTKTQERHSESASAKPELNEENLPNSASVKVMARADEENLPNSASVKVMARADEENQQPASKDTELHVSSDAAMASHSPNEDQMSQLSSQHGYSDKNEKVHVSVDNVNGSSLSKDSLSRYVVNQSLDSNEDLVPVEMLPNEESMIRTPHRSKKYSAKKLNKHASFDSTDSDTPHQKMRVRRHMKQQSDDDLQSRIERASHSNYTRKML
ncbi:unnamed protein product [Candidula unifasciata]|uniref:Uncharacterized protein n=1 Tax=Candidula unifasciata TaxID=100452 RepID=A0A8S3ZF43_9EUPU|nr:unnamed protein product [Candidula unifasciata]